MHELSKDEEVGDYVSEFPGTVSNYSRTQVCLLIEEIHGIKEYKLDTLYTAVSLVDRYLVRVIVKKQKLPCMITLAVTCLLIAAKLEESICPSFIRMKNIIF